MMKLFWLLLFFSVFLFYSCNNDIVYEKEIEFQESIFSKSDELKFDFEILDTASKYDLYLEVNHDVQFAFQNLYVKIKTIFPDKKSIEDVVSLELSKSGTEWQGNCSGDNCIVPILLVEKTMFQSLGKYQILLNQYGREKKIEGINSLKLIVKKTTVEK